jgi:hypothetical protein
VAVSVRRSELLDYETYRERRKEIQKAMFPVKQVRRVHLGRYLTFLFENADTIRYQIQEMMLAERIVKEEAIQHELDTYNSLLGGAGVMGCALLIEIEEKDERPKLLSRWLDLPRHIYVRLEDGSKVYATYDPGQVGEDRVSAVQYLKFDTGGKLPTAVGTDHPELEQEVGLTDDQRHALEEDLQAT